MITTHSPSGRPPFAWSWSLIIVAAAEAASLGALHHDHYSFSLWTNQSQAVLHEEAAFTNQRRRRLDSSRAHIGKKTTIAAVHVSRSGGLTLNKLFTEQRGITSLNGVQRFPDCIIPRLAYGNSTVPIGHRYDFPHCEILSAIWPLPTLEAKLAFKKEVVYITMLRDPASRVMSQWRSDTVRLPAVFGKCKAFEQLFAGIKSGGPTAASRTCLSKGTQPVQYIDYATLMVGGCKWDGDKRACTASSTFDAAHLLSRFAFVGILEHFDISICLFYFTVGDEGKFKKFCKHRTHHAPRTNRAPKPGGDPFRSVFSPAALSYVWLANRKDQELYWTAYRSFVRDVSVMEAATNVHFLSRLYRKESGGGGGGGGSLSSSLHLDY